MQGSRGDGYGVHALWIVTGGWIVPLIMWTESGAHWLVSLAVAVAVVFAPAVLLTFNWLVLRARSLWSRRLRLDKRERRIQQREAAIAKLERELQA